MENWSYNIKTWWILHGTNVKRYGLCALIIAAGVHGSSYFIAWIGLFIAACMAAYDRFNGAYWQALGATALSRKKNPQDIKK